VPNFWNCIKNSYIWSWKTRWNFIFVVIFIFHFIGFIADLLLKFLIFIRYFRTLIIRILLILIYIIFLWYTRTRSFSTYYNNKSIIITASRMRGSSRWNHRIRFVLNLMSLALAFTILSKYTKFYIFLNK